MVRETFLFEIQYIAYIARVWRSKGSLLDFPKSIFTTDNINVSGENA